MRGNEKNESNGESAGRVQGGEEKERMRKEKSRNKGSHTRIKSQQSFG